MGERDIIIKLVGLFRKYRISYILTGSFAVSYWGRPRATHDIDFVVELKPTEVSSIFNVVKDLGRGFDFSEDQVKQAVKDHFFFNVIHDESGIKIDFWIAKNDEFEREKFRRRVEVKLFDQTVFIISAEDLILTKLFWNKTVFSECHRRDCVGIWQIQKENLDLAYLNNWAKKLGVTKLLQEIHTSKY